MSYRYSRYLARLARAPWCILPEKFAAITELMRFRVAGGRLSDEEIADRLADADHDRIGRQAAFQAATASLGPAGSTVAVIPIHGTIAHRADSFDASSGGTSTESVGRALKQAVNNEAVSGILLDFDSPGGSVEGVPELAAAIRQATTVKPVIAQANAMAASAGYWLASNANEIVITPSGSVGSIGVFMLLVDASEAMAKEGVKINAISAGDYKLEGAPWEPLSADARSFLQGQVDQVYGDFLSAVASGRGISVADVRKNYGQGRMFDAKEAVRRGMADRVATMDETLARMVSGRMRVRRSAIAETAGYWHDSISDLTGTVTMTGASNEFLLNFDVQNIQQVPGSPVPVPAVEPEPSEDLLLALASLS